MPRSPRRPPQQRNLDYYYNYNASEKNINSYVRLVF